MKKIIYILLLVISSAIISSACTEEGDVTPTQSESGGGYGAPGKI